MASSERLLFPLLLVALAGCATPRASSLADLSLRSTTSADQRSVEQLISTSDATVFAFWSGSCPCVRRYQARLEALAAQWAPKGIAFVQVSSNAGESVERIAEVAKERQLQLPVWRDEGGQLARTLEARSTPTVVLVRRDGQVLFRGWIDNERLPGEPGREAWLEAALEGFTAGRAFASRTPTWGCTITRSLTATAAAPSCHVPQPGETP
ncbi:MAG: redoxin domain-containing protein [Myxococcota bacterium]